jgi:hypothetical protein
MSGMLDVTRQNDKPQDYKKTLFIGQVVANDDISKLHRVKVRIPNVWDDYEPEQLPWCFPKCLPGGGGATEYWQNIPETGSYVYVEFLNGDDMFPVYYGGVRDHRTMEGVLHENYPHRIGFDVNSFMEVHEKDERHRIHVAKEDPVPYPRFRHHFFIDRMTNETEYKHATETKINIADNGTMKVEVRARDLPDGGDFIMHTDRHYVLEVSQALFDGEPGHYYCDVLEDWWETHVETHVLLKSRTSDITIEAAQNIFGEAGVNIELTAGEEVRILAEMLVDITAPAIVLNGFVVINGALHINGNVTHIGNNTQIGVHVDSIGVHV